MLRSSFLMVALATTACAGSRPAAGVDAPLAIGQVQGAASRSARIDTGVVVDGVVTQRLHGDAQMHGGVFVQDAGDGDASTSDALFVVGAATDAVRVGDAVRVQGRVVELDTGRGATLTALDAVSITPRPARAQPDALRIATAPADWEPLEGMRVVFDRLHLDGHADLRDAGLLWTSLGDAAWQATERARPDARVPASRTRIQLDDTRLGAADRNDTPWPRAFATARSGSTLTRVEGVVDARDGGYRVQVTRVGAIDAAPRPAAPRVAGDLRIAALNLENLFNGDGAGGGFPTPRGARTPAELDVQLSKHVATLRALDADVVALMEAENDGHGPRSAEGQLAAALRRATSQPWRGVDAGTRIGGDEIRVGLLYRSDRVRPIGRAAMLRGGPFDARSRVPLAQAFVPVARGNRSARGDAFVVVANHFKSKGCGDARGADADRRDGQACWNATRLDSARRLHAWLATDPTRSRATRTVLLGDFNAYAQEDPIAWLRDAGWRDAFEVARVDAPYSYVYEGQRGRLDHALLSADFAADLRGAAEWHVNADEPESLGYRDHPQGANTPWRGSDHDPLLLGFDLRGAAR